MNIKSRIVALLSITLGALILGGCDRDRTKMTRTVDFSEPIREIVVEGCWTVQISPSSNTGVSLEYSSFLGNKISAKVDNGCLRLKLRNAFVGVTHDDLKAVVSLPDITRIKASGAARVVSDGLFRGEGTQNRNRARRCIDVPHEGQSRKARALLRRCIQSLYA